MSRDSRNVILRLSALICCCASLTGCTVGRKWFQFDSNSRMPGVGLELRAENSRTKSDEFEATDSSVIAPAEFREESSGKRFRDWFRLRRNDTTIPLTPTEPGSTNPRPAFQGPVEEFD